MAVKHQVRVVAELLKKMMFWMGVWRKFNHGIIKPNRIDTRMGITLVLNERRRTSAQA